MKSEYEALEDLVRTRYASVAWTHKIQEKQAEIYDKRYRILATVNIFAASITSAGIFSLIFTDQTWLKITSAVVSFVTIFISALLRFCHRWRRRSNCAKGCNTEWTDHE